MVLRKPSRKVQEINIQGSELIAVKTVAQMKALEDLEDKQRILVYDPLKKDPPVEYVWINSEFLKVTGSGISTPGGGTGEGGGTTIITTQTIVVPTLAERDALTDLKMDDRVIVLDATGDENVSGKVAEYLYRGKEWVLLSKQGKDGKDGLDGAAANKGDKGDPFKYEDFTPEQLEALRGPKGEDGTTVNKGDKGDKGDPFKYEDFTPEQLEVLRGPKGEDGADGKDGKSGSNFTLIENTSQLNVLMGKVGDRVYNREDQNEYVFYDGRWNKSNNKIDYDDLNNFVVKVENIQITNEMQFISKKQKEMIKTNNRDIEILKNEIKTIDITPPSDGKIKINVNDELSYLDKKLGNTLAKKGSVIEVIQLLGQIATVDELNHMQGIRMNVQSQIDALSRFGNFTGSVENKVALLALPTPTLNDMVIVLEDESQGSESTIYMHDGVQWVFAGKFSIKMRDFLVDKIDINIETKDILKKDRYDLPVAKDILMQEKDKKISLAKNIEEALNFLAKSMTNAEKEITTIKENSNLSVQVVQVRERQLLPLKGNEGTVYIVESDETNEDKKTLYIWVIDETGKGNYELIIASSVSGIIQEYQQVTKLSVVAPRTYEMPIPRTQNFLRAPIEILSFTKGTQNVKVDAAFNNKSSGDFLINPEVSFSEKGFTISEYLSFKGEVFKQTDEGIIQKVDLQRMHNEKNIIEVF